MPSVSSDASAVFFVVSCSFRRGDKRTFGPGAAKDAGGKTRLAETADALRAVEAAIASAFRKEGDT